MAGPGFGVDSVDPRIDGLLGFELATEVQIPISPTQGKVVVIGTLVFLMVTFYWYYSWKQNGVRVICSFEKRGNSASYARIGAFIWYESLLVLFIVAGALILCQKLTGWPPPP